jgi:GT2 family glycosyltransferase
MSVSDLAVVIPVFNGWQQTKRCLQSLREADATTALEVVVIDHGSTDGTTTELPRLFPEVTHIIESERLWWTGATNVGIRHALEKEARWVMPLNNDCEITGKDVRTLLDHAATTPGVIAPLQVASDGTTLFAGASSCIPLGLPTLHVTRRVPGGDGPLSRTRLIMGGRGAIIPREVIDTVGLFEEKLLPHYLADHDFYLRCRKAGVPLWVAADATVRVDATRTSVATNPSALTWSAFKDSLRNPRSHRNIPALTAFFRLHYPIRRLYWIGVGLNIARYFARWAISRPVALVVTRDSR